MSVNKVVYNKKTLIDLSSDTVTSDTLLWGCVAHRADGTMITGIMFENYPDEQYFYDVLLDSNGSEIKDNTASKIKGKTVYKKV